VDGDDAWQKLGGAARYAKIDAENNNCVNNLLVQVNQDATIRYAKAIGEHSSNSWIWTPAAQDMEGETKIELEVRQVKGRNQSRRSFKIGVDLETMRLFVPDNPYDINPKPSEKSGKERGVSRKSVESLGQQKSRVTIDEDGAHIDESDGTAEEYAEKLMKD
jgi:hypothetical protein